MDRRGHAVHGIDAVYIRPTTGMRQRLRDGLEQLRQRRSPSGMSWRRGQWPCIK